MPRERKREVEEHWYFFSLYSKHRDKSSAFSELMAVLSYFSTAQRERGAGRFSRFFCWFFSLAMARKVFPGLFSFWNCLTSFWSRTPGQLPRASPTKLLCGLDTRAEPQRDWKKLSETHPTKGLSFSEPQKDFLAFAISSEQQEVSLFNSIQFFMLVNAC